MLSDILYLYLFLKTVNKGITETNMLLGHIRGGGDLEINCDIIMIYWW
jgi:hypothetical protein